MGDIVAAAARYTAELFGKNRRQASQADSAWQPQAWGYYFDTPEVRFGAMWCGNVMSRCRLIAGRRAPDGTIAPIEDPNHRAVQLVASIAGGPVGQSAMLKEFGPHLVVAGEAWVVIEPDGKWHVASVLEVRQQSGVLEVTTAHGKIVKVPLEGDTPNPDDAIGIRVWEPNPAKHAEADSPIRASFTLLDELRLLNAAVAAIAKSRLSGRGVFVVPSGTKFAGDAESSEDNLTEKFLQVAATAYAQPDSAAAAVPIILEVPADAAAQFDRITFESEFDSLAVTLREECIRRFASSLDTPAEILLGTGGMNHWSLWATDEAGLRVAIEPKLITICDAYTEQWLQPALQSEGVADADECVVWFDSSGARIKVDEAKTAFELYDRGEITGDALRRATDHGDDDAPDDDERRRSLLERLVTAAPSLWPQIGPLLGFDVPAGAGAPAGDGSGDATVPSAELPVHEDPSPPDTFDDSPDAGQAPAAALVAACDGLVWRAIERAGTKLRSRAARADRPQLQDIDASAMHVAVPVPEADLPDLLDRAWDRVPTIANRHGVDAGQLTELLASYVGVLLVGGLPYDEAHLAVALGDLEPIAEPEAA